MASRLRTRGLLCTQPLGSKGVQDEGWLTGTHRKTRWAQAGGGLACRELEADSVGRETLEGSSQAHRGGCWWRWDPPRGLWALLGVIQREGREVASKYHL